MDIAQSKNTSWTALAALGASLSLVACGQNTGEAAAPGPSTTVDLPNDTKCASIDEKPLRIRGGSFIMGQEDVYPSEEGPVRETYVNAFWIDPHEVTNRQFANFADSTSYVTLAERPVDPSMFGLSEKQIPPELLLPGSAVFTPPDRPSQRYTDWWTYVPGASWKKPYGPNGPNAQDEQPVVHLGWEDMVAYARWAGGRIPTEAEWEYAAGAGAEPVSGQPDGKSANTWQGVFPLVNDEIDGFQGVAPVGCFRPNANGLYDMIGNVWEVTQDYYRPGHDPAGRENPRGPSENAAYDPYNPGLPTRVVKGGSYLCAPNYCQRYRPASRQGRDPGLGASNVGFRLAYDSLPDFRSPREASTESSDD